MNLDFKFEFQCPVILTIKKTIWFNVLCINFSIETKMKALFLILYFNLSKKTQNGTLSYVMARNSSIHKSIV